MSKWSLLLVCSVRRNFACLVVRLEGLLCHSIADFVIKVIDVTTKIDVSRLLLKVLIIIDEVWKEKNSFLYNQGATLTLMPWFLESISDMKTILQSLIKGRKASNLSRLMIKEAPYSPSLSFHSIRWWLCK